MGFFEDYRKLCENQELLYSDYITCGHGPKNHRQRKGADCSPGDHLQIPVRAQSKPHGVKMLDGEIDCAEASQSNRNPSLYILIETTTFLGHTRRYSYNFCQIFCSDYLETSLVGSSRIWSKRPTALGGGPGSYFTSLVCCLTCTGITFKLYFYGTYE
jgi:hypothetical protein